MSSFGSLWLTLLVLMMALTSKVTLGDKGGRHFGHHNKGHLVKVPLVRRPFQHAPAPFHHGHAHPSYQHDFRKYFPSSPGPVFGRSHRSPRGIARFSKYFPGPARCTCEYPPNPLLGGVAPTELWNKLPESVRREEVSGYLYHKTQHRSPRRNSYRRW